MLAQLRKLAAHSAAIREAAIAKEAGILGTVGNWAMKNPLTAVGAGLTAAMAPGAAMKSYQKHQAGFAQAPVPPSQG